MALYGVEFTVTYTAWDTSANAGKTGDVANHTLRWVKDGTAAAPTNEPAEVDATNCPGTYKLVVTAAEAQCVFGCLAGKSSTANVSIMPVHIAFERLPNVAPGASNGLPILDANGCISADATGVQAAAAAALTAYDPPTNAELTAAVSPLALEATLTAIKGAGWSTETLAAIDALIDAIKAKTDNLPTSPAAVGSKMDLVDAPNATALEAVADAVLDEEVNSASATGNSLRASAKAAWAQGFGRWVLSGTTLTLYGTDGTTPVRTFTLDDADAPTSRTPT